MTPSLRLLVPFAVMICGGARISSGMPPGHDEYAVRMPTPPPLAVYSGRLTDLVSSLIQIRDECRPLQFPSPSQIQLSRQALRLLLDQQLDQACWIYSMLGLEVIRLVENHEQWLIIREGQDEQIRGWGFFALAVQPRRQLVLEAPHPQHDQHTGEQTARLATLLGARAVLIATTHRCASKRPTGCQGKTGACRQIWGRGRYRRSDHAHITNTFFHAAHSELLLSDPRLVALQLHGFSRRPGRRVHIILSDGTRLPGKPGNLANGLARTIRSLLPREKKRLVRSCNETSRQHFLCGTHNVQGRQANGASKPCRRPARRSSNRFVQIEQSLDARTPNGLIDPHLLDAAMRRFFPEQPSRSISHR